VAVFFHDLRALDAVRPDGHYVDAERQYAEGRRRDPTTASSPTRTTT
jgi:hypothetical protein